MTYPTSKLDRAVDREIASVNAAFLADEEAQRHAAETGALWARASETGTTHACRVCHSLVGVECVGDEHTRTPMTLDDILGQS